MFYDKFLELCSAIGKKPSRVAEELGINKSNVAGWKKSGYTPRGDVITKIAEYFKVPTGFVLEQPPFDHWEAINKNRKRLIELMEFPSGLVEEYVFSDRNVDTYDLISFINFVDHTTKKVEICENNVLISANSQYYAYSPMYWNSKEEQKEKPATGEGDGLTDKQRALRDAIIDLDDADLQKQVIEYIEFLKSKRNS